MSYVISGIETYQDSHETFCGIKLDGQYRYFLLVHSIEKGYLFTLIDSKGDILDHFLRVSNDKIEDMVLKICKEYDSFLYPELFETNVLQT
jgi:hypothetical protein